MFWKYSPIAVHTHTWIQIGIKLSFCYTTATGNATRKVNSRKQSNKNLE